MTDNIFVYRFNKMTNDELEAISFNEDVYTNEARLTALDILKNRDVNSEAINTTHRALMAEKVAQEKIVIENKPSPTATFIDIENVKSETKPLPKLYSKTLILVISILFSTLFGSVLLILNLKKTGHSKARKLVFLFSVCYLFVPFILITSFNLDPNVALLANVLGGYILTEYFWNQYIGKNTEYKRLDWAKPVLIMLAITIPLAYIVLKSGGAL
ncbi:hypothetical protein ACJOV8_010255 [Formosa sp. 3Alg 14/1]|uniref:hypothetical protein n=1 Tax=Formosa sp. 3Alg 14/1 TaxID=3382190 RepID=UPI0039BEB33F